MHAGHVRYGVQAGTTDRAAAGHSLRTVDIYVILTDDDRTTNGIEGGVHSIFSYVHE